LSLGFYYSRRSDKSLSHYFLADRNIGWFAIGMSVFATNISSEHFIGLAGSGASRGLAVGQIELMAIFLLIILGWFLAPIYLKANVYTVPEFLEKRFDKTSRKIFAGISILMYILTKMSITLFAGGILFNKIFGINIYTSAIIIVLITGLYSIIGGFPAVINTQVFQSFMLIVGAVILTILGLHEVGGIGALQEKLPHDYFSMFKPMSDPDFPWTGILFGAPIIAFWYWCTDQFIVQRILGARNVNAARSGSILAAFLKLLPLFILVMPGLIAAALFPETRGDEAYPVLMASNIIPAGIKGLIVAGLLAAIMSSLASVFNSTATLFAMDFYKPKHLEASDEKLVLIGRLFTLLTVVIAILCVPLLKIVNAQIYIYLQSIQAYVSPPITVLFVFGLLFKKANAKGALWTLIVGEFLGLMRIIAELLTHYKLVESSFITHFASINFLHFAIISFLGCSAFFYLVSYFSTEKIEDNAENIYSFFTENLTEIKYNIRYFGKTVSEYRASLMFSLIILIVVLCLWGFWL
jgi:transporter, SSS family